MRCPSCNKSLKRVDAPGGGEKLWSCPMCNWQEDPEIRDRPVEDNSFDAVKSLDELPVPLQILGWVMLFFATVGVTTVFCFLGEAVCLLAPYWVVFLLYLGYCAITPLHNPEHPIGEFNVVYELMIRLPVIGHRRSTGLFDFDRYYPSDRRRRISYILAMLPGKLMVLTIKSAWQRVFRKPENGGD